MNRLNKIRKKCAVILKDLEMIHNIAEDMLFDVWKMDQNSKLVDQVKQIFYLTDAKNTIDKMRYLSNRKFCDNNPGEDVQSEFLICSYSSNIMDRLELSTAGKHPKLLDMSKLTLISIVRSSSCYFNDDTLLLVKVLDSHKLVKGVYLKGGSLKTYSNALEAWNNFCTMKRCITMTTRIPIFQIWKSESYANDEVKKDILEKTGTISEHKRDNSGVHNNDKCVKAEVKKDTIENTSSRSVGLKRDKSVVSNEVKFVDVKANNCTGLNSEVIQNDNVKKSRKNRKRKRVRRVLRERNIIYNVKSDSVSIKSVKNDFTRYTMLNFKELELRLFVFVTQDEKFKALEVMNKIERLTITQ